jgi:hypothetical protein
MDKISYLKLTFILSTTFPGVLLAYDWPIKEFASPHPIYAVLGEFRDTDGSHLHQGVDIGANSGTSVYAIDSGIVFLGGSAGNTNVRIGDKIYVHINQRIAENTNVDAGMEIGKIIDNHVHIQENNGTVTPLRTTGISPYSDGSMTHVSTLDFFRQETNTQITSPLYGRLKILSRAWDAQDNGSNNVGIYRIGYQIDDYADNTIIGPVCNIRFDSIGNATLNNIYDTSRSDNSTYYYWVTNGMNDDRYWDTKLKTGEPWNGINAKVNNEAISPDGKYKVTVMAYDIQGNGGDIEHQLGAITKEVAIDNFRPYVQEVSVAGYYSGQWTFDGAKLNIDKNTIGYLKPGSYTITIKFSEPVESEEGGRS